MDTPGHAEDQVYATPLEVEGWAWSSSGIARVLVVVDRELEFEAFLGISRPDVAARLGEAAAHNAGFTCPLGTDVLPPGSHKLEVVAVGRDGLSSEWKVKIRTRRWAYDAPSSDVSRADSPRPVIADGDHDESDPLFDRLVQVEGDLALAHYRLIEAQAQADYAMRRVQVADQALEKLAEERRLRAELVNSMYWRITRPLRLAERAFRRRRAAGRRR